MFRSVEMEKENRYSLAADLGCEELHAVTKMKAYVRRTLHQKAEVETQPPLG